MTNYTTPALPPPLPEQTLGQHVGHQFGRFGKALAKLGLGLVGIVFLFNVGGSNDAPTASTKTFNYYQFADIMDSAKSNEAKFERDYKGHLLRISGPFHSSNTTLGSRQVWFGDHNVVCHMSEAMYFKTSNWSKGQNVMITGRMKRVGFMGSLALDDCEFE